MMKKYCYGIALIMLIGMLTGCAKKPVLKLKQDIFTLELGEVVNLDPNYYLNTDQLSDEIKEKLDQEILFAVYTPESSVRTQDGKAYPMPGSYEGTISYKKETVNFTVEVKDSVAPVITGLESIELAMGTEFNYLDYYSASDLNELEEIQYDASAIDVNTEGTYTLKISVEDAARNEGVKEVPVTIKGVTDQQEVSSEVVTNEDGTQSYVTTTIDKPVVYDPPAVSSNQEEYYGEGSTIQAPVQSTAPNNNTTSNSQTIPPSEPDRTESVCTPQMGNSKKLFDSEDEAIAWAEEQMDIDKCVTYRGYGYMSTCGKFTVDFTYK